MLKLLVIKSDVLVRLINGASGKIQLGSLLAAFKVTREMIKAEVK